MASHVFRFVLNVVDAAVNYALWNAQFIDCVEGVSLRRVSFSVTNANSVRHVIARASVSSFIQLPGTNPRSKAGRRVAL